MKRTGYLGLDIGGTGVRAGVFARAGTLAGFAKRSWTALVPAEGGAEVPIEQIYAAARDATLSAIRQSGACVKALAVSSQGQTFVSLDENDEPLHPAILWYDSRAAEQAAALHKALSEAKSDPHVPAPSAVASAPKIMWLHEHHPALMARARRYLLVPDYVAYRLTGLAVTDPWTAASTGLLTLGKASYNPEALAAAGIGVDQLASVQEAGTIIGTVRPAVAEEWGLDRETLVVTGTNDQYAGALGAGNCRCGILSVAMGTCLALVTLTLQPPDPVAPGLLVGPFPLPPYLYVLAYLKTAGVVLDWFRDQFHPVADLAELDRAASSVPIGSRGLTFLPHLDGMDSPVPNPKVRGALWGLTLQHTRADVYRAILESLAFSLRENTELMRDSGLQVDVIRSIGGSAGSDVWLQMEADVTGLPVERPAVTEAAVAGAAMLAAVGCAEFASLVECCKVFYRQDRVFLPDAGRHKLYQGPYERYGELRRRLYG